MQYSIWKIHRGEVSTARALVQRGGGRRIRKISVGIFDWAKIHDAKVQSCISHSYVCHSECVEHVDQLASVCVACYPILRVRSNTDHEHEVSDKGRTFLCFESLNSFIANGKGKIATNLEAVKLELNL